MPHRGKKNSGHWSELDRHFAQHEALIKQFRNAEAPAVLRMWGTQTNELGAPLSPDERQALVERHCELFGHWPQ